MKTTKTSAAKTSANKTNTTSANANATKGAKGNKADNKTTKADKDTTPAPAPTTPQDQPTPAAAVTDTTANKDGGKVAAFDAATIASTAAAWLAEYKSIRGIKDQRGALLAAVGYDNYNAVVKAAKASRAADIENTAAAVAGVLSYTAVLDREFSALAASADWGKWCGLVSANWENAAAFVAACYPYTLENGQPARAVDYTNGTSIYRAFRPLQYKDGAGAVAILLASLENLKKHHKRAADKGKDGGALVCTKVYKDGAAVAVYGLKMVDCVSKDGRQYRKATKADKGAPLAVAVSVLSAGKDGHRLATLAEFNADLRA
jgi:hypothetical protein